MDKLTLLGLVISLAGILTGQLLEGGGLAILFQLAAFLIVLGGTLGAILIQSPREIFSLAMYMGRWAFKPPVIHHEEQIRQIVGWASIARKDGILGLEQRVNTLKDPFLKKGAQLLVDGTTPQKIREVMEIDMQSWEQPHWQAARVWEAAAGYAPTIGIIGAVLGLMHVMQNLSDPSKLGAGIAVAFVATIYGVAFANLLFLPIANKLKIIIMAQSNFREMIIDGIVSIANGDNPRLIDIKLNSYFNQELANGTAKKTRRT